MKNFSKNWKSSKSRRKQRKYFIKADKTKKHKTMSVNLSKELRKKFKMRNVKPRKDDLTRVMRGEFYNKEGKIVQINLRDHCIHIAGAQNTKKDGTKINISFDPSNLQIKELNLDDKKRLKKMR